MAPWLLFVYSSASRKCIPERFLIPKHLARHHCRGSYHGGCKISISRYLHHHRSLNTSSHLVLHRLHPLPLPGLHRSLHPHHLLSSQILLRFLRLLPRRHLHRLLHLCHLLFQPLHPPLALHRLPHLHRLACHHLRLPHHHHLLLRSFTSHFQTATCETFRMTFK